jgi:sugar lactone lactonase YvrE
LKISIATKLRIWLLVALLGCSVWAQETDPENKGTPTNVEESIEALFGPDKEEEEPVEQAAPPKSDEPILYIADTDNGRIVVMQGLEGIGYTTVGVPGFGFGRFLRPCQVWVDYARRLYVADSGNDRVIRIDQSAREGWTELGGFSTPMGVAVDKSGVYIADTKADRVVLVEEVKEGSPVLEVLTRQQMTRPTSLWIDAEGALYICCGEDPPGGRVFKTWKEKDRRRWEMFEGEGLSGSRFRPAGLVTQRNQIRFVDESGQRVITMNDMTGKRIRELPFRSDREFRLSRPGGIAIDKTGKRFFLADSGNDRILEVRGDGSVVGVFTQMPGDSNSVLRNPTSVFVFTPAPAPDPEGEGEGEGEGDEDEEEDE